jgi:hypothetical protein
LRQPVIAALAITFAGLTLPSTVSAAVTIGSALGTSQTTLSCTNPGDCTVVQTALPGRRVTSPIDGVVVRWRVKNTSSPIPGRFRILRRQTGTTFTGVASAQAGTGDCPDVCVNEARLPICTGDYIGIDGPTGASGGARNTTGAVLAGWTPFLRDGETRGSDFRLGASEIALNADVEPDADRDGFGDETQDSDPTTPAATRPPCRLSLSLRLHYEHGHDSAKRPCARDREVSAEVTGRDVDSIKSVAFRFGHRPPIVDSQPPFAREVDDSRHLGESHYHRLAARVLAKDGRHARLRRRLRFCAQT